MKDSQIVVNNDNTCWKLFKHIVHHVGGILSHLFFSLCKLFRLLKRFLCFCQLPVCLPEGFNIFLLVFQVEGMAHLRDCQTLCDGGGKFPARYVSARSAV